MTNLSYTYAVQQLLGLQANKEKWTSGPIMVTVSKLLDDDLKEMIVITLTLGHKKRMSVSL